MTDELPVHVNRDGRRELDVPDTIEVTDSFNIRFVNHGEATHVHLNTDDSLSRAVTVDAGNRHVPGSGERRVRIDVETGGLERDAVYGTLELSTGYGAEQRVIDVEVRDPEAAQTTVDVDERLSEPPSGGAGLFDRPELVVLGLAMAAATLATVTAAVVDETVVVVGVSVVVGGVLVALGFLLRRG